MKDILMLMAHVCGSLYKQMVGGVKRFSFFPFMYCSSGNSGLNLHKYVSFFLSLLCGSVQLSCL